MYGYKETPGVENFHIQGAVKERKKDLHEFNLCVGMYLHPYSTGVEYRLSNCLRKSRTPDQILGHSIKF